MRNLDEVKSEASDLAEVDKVRDAPRATFGDVAAAFREFLFLSSDEPIRVAIAAFVANRFENAEPVWLFLVAPSSSAKTEIVNALDGIPGTYMLSQLTPNTLLSGVMGRQGSLLKRISSRAVLLHKDFTTILSMRPDDRAVIMSQLREVYDGKLVREFGTGKTESWKGKLGLVSGVTLEIENAIMASSRYGDRFLYYRLPELDEREVMGKIRANSSRSSRGMREAIRVAVAGYVASLDIPESPPDVPKDVFDAVSSMCIFAAKARTPVERDQYSSSKTIMNVQAPEGIGRVVKEVLAFAGALIVMRGGSWSPEDYGLLSSIVFNAIPSRRLRPTDAIYRHGSGMTTQELAVELQLPANAVRYTMDELAAIGVVEKSLVRRDQGNPNALSEVDDKNGTYMWTMPDHVRRLYAFRDSVEGTPAPPRFLADPVEAILEGES